MEERQYNARQEAAFGGGFGIGSLMNFLDVWRLLRLLVRRLWVIALAGMIVGSCAYVYARTTYVPEYMVQTTLAFTKKTYITTKDDDGNIISVKEVTSHFTSNTDIQRYQFLLTSSAMGEALAAKLGGEYSPGTIQRSMRVSSTNVTGFFNLTVRSTNYDLCANCIAVVITEYSEFLKKYDSTLNIDVINKPTGPYVTNSSSATKTGIYGALIGAAAVAALLLLVDMFANTVRSPDDVRNKTSAKLLGSVPLVELPQGRWRRKKRPKNGVLITDESSVTFNFVESFKSIRTKLESLSAEKGYKVFAITSTFEDEGKTTVSTNIACALAQKGKSVLLIDCDLRKPAVLNSLGLHDSESTGLLPIIDGAATYEYSMIYIKQLRLFVLSTGGTTPESTEKLAMDQMRAIIEKARGEFDYVILDTPPARVVADCISLAPYMDGLVYSIRYDYARVAQINETLDEIANAGIRVVGSVLTMAASEALISRNGYSSAYRRPGKYYGGYGYGYGGGQGSGYRKGYGEEPRRRDDG